VNVYPTPAHDFIKIETTGVNEYLDFVMTDITGREVKHETIPSSGSVISLNGFPGSVYFYSITGETGFVRSGKIVVE
jgi:hypothetical protein